MKIKNFPFTNELLILNTIFNKEGQDNLRIVGGSIRNFLLNKEINDFDLSSKFKPDEVIKILELNNIKYIPTGIKFGTIMAILNGKSFEITSARKDIKTDGRHAIVEYTDNFKIDAERRDFTFNALYLDFQSNIYDYFDGISDLNKGIVRFIGSAEKRIQEDYLRILRFFRFFCYYGSVFDNEGLEYCKKYKNKLKTLSGERIKSEMLKILNCDYPIKTLKIMEQNNILQLILNFNSFNFKNLEIFYSIKKDINLNILYKTITLSLLIKNKQQFETLKKRWKLSKKETSEILKLINHKNESLYDEKELKKNLFINKDKEFLLNLTIFNAILNVNKLKINLVSFISSRLNFIKNIDIPIFPITGDDLKLFSVFNSKKYNNILNYGKEIFIDSDYKMSKDEILKKLILIHGQLSENHI